MENELKEYGLHIEHSEADGREPIDFEIRDEHDELWATVWGSNPINDIEIDCNHPAVEFDDDEHVGECPVCGAWATWHWDVCSEDGCVYKEQVVDTWMPQKKIGGIVGKYLKELQAKNA